MRPLLITAHEPPSTSRFKKESFRWDETDRKAAYNPSLTSNHPPQHDEIKSSLSKSLQPVPILGGSWVIISRVISTPTGVIDIVALHGTLLVSTHPQPETLNPKTKT